MEGLSDDARFLFLSDNRVDVLVAIVASGPLDRYDVEERLDASRRTAVRSLEALCERGYVRETDAGYDATALGDAVAASCEEFVETSATAERLAPFLRRIPARRFDLDPTLLADAEVVVPTDASPYAPLDRVLQLRAESGTVRELSTIVEHKSLRQLADRVESGEEFDVEVVVEAGVLEAAADNPAYRPFQERILGSGNVEILVHGDVPMLLAVLDGERVALGVSEGNEPGACVVSDRPEVVEWAEATYERVRREARPPGSG